MDNVIRHLEKIIGEIQQSLDIRARKIDQFRDEVAKETPIYEKEETLLSEYESALEVLKLHMNLEKDKE